MVGSSLLPKLFCRTLEALWETPRLSIKWICQGDRCSSKWGKRRHFLTTFWSELCKKGDKMIWLVHIIYQAKTYHCLCLGTKIEKEKKKKSKWHLYKQARKETYLNKHLYKLSGGGGASIMKEKQIGLMQWRDFTGILEEASILAKKMINVYPCFLEDIYIYGILKPSYYLVNAECYSANSNVVSRILRWLGYTPSGEQFTS